MKKAASSYYPTQKKGLFFLGIGVALLLGGGVLYYFYRRATNQNGKPGISNINETEILHIDASELAIRAISKNEIISIMTGFGLRFIEKDDTYYKFEMPLSSFDDVDNWARSKSLELEDISRDWFMWESLF